MSYDIIVRKYCPSILDINYTFNVSPMFRLALGGDGIKQLNNLSRDECIELLQDGIKHMEQNPEIYKKLNPENGWGDYEGALDVLVKTLEALQHSEDTYVNIEY
jgi:hypothetical protein